MLTAAVIIPARFASTRFPGKMLAAETGRPLVQHVVDRCRQCRRVREVLVATDDPRISDALSAFGTHCVMTSPDHRSGTDRIAEAAANLADEIFVNVQGDEPEIEPGVIDALIERMEKSGSPMATAATPFPPDADPADPNLVKVLLGTADNAGRAIYFSRAPIPFRRDATDGSNAPYHLHLGLYAYRRDFLAQYVKWPQTPAEVTEKLEQLRAIERGHAIDVLTVSRPTHGIDTPDQYAAFVRRFRAASTGGPS